MLRFIAVLLMVSATAAIRPAPAFCQLPVIEEASASQVLAAVRSGGSSVTVVNFWATWCIPCREELPAYVRIGREFDPDKVRMIFISTDFAEDVPEARQFLAEYGVTGLTYRNSDSDRAFMDSFSGEWSGALPATGLFDNEGNLAEFWEGRTTYDRLKERIMQLLKAESMTNRKKEE